MAAGEPLRVAQDDVVLRGHAVEARVYAEDPARGFLPTGGARAARRRAGRGRRPRRLRASPTGDVVGGDYDPMLAKVVAWGEDRADRAAPARRRAGRHRRPRRHDQRRVPARAARATPTSWPAGSTPGWSGAGSTTSCRAGCRTTSLAVAALARQALRRAPGATRPVRHAHRLAARRRRRGSASCSRSPAASRCRCAVRDGEVRVGDGPVRRGGRGGPRRRARRHPRRRDRPVAARRGTGGRRRRRPLAGPGRRRLAGARRGAATARRPRTGRRRRAPDLARCRARSSPSTSSPATRRRPAGRSRSWRR